MKTRLLSLLISAVALFSCQKETPNYVPIIGLGGDEWIQGRIDSIIYADFVYPYNIEVIYKWNPFDLNFNRTLVPPDEARVPAVLSAIKNIWMLPYEQLGGTTFLQNFSLTRFNLVGSAEYQDSGTIILGTAEGGSKITLFVVNQFELSNRAAVVQMLHTIHHEFAHILHQTIDYPQEWRGLSTSWYTATWFNTSNQEANAQGLITSYAKAAEREDFVETIAYLLVEGQAAYDLVVLQNPAVAQIFRQKENLVVTYYQNAFQIDFRALQTEVRAAIDSLVTNN